MIIFTKRPFVLFAFIPFLLQVFLPVNIPGRKDLSAVHLTKIGAFGLPRKERPAVPSHLHTGIDIMRPGGNYTDEPVFPIAKGKVISKRTDGAYAQLIIEHEINGEKFWSVYEHIAGIKVKLNEEVDPFVPIARYMNKNELNKLGWQFDHLHLEILKTKPTPLKPGSNNPERLFSSYTLICYTPKDLEKYFYSPMDFFETHFSGSK